MKKVRETVWVLAVVVAALVGWGSVCWGTIDYGSASWSVEHIVNNSQTVFGVDQGAGGVNGPRNNRALALSADGQSMYLGYGEPGWFVRKVELGHAPEDNLTSVQAQLALTDEGKGLNWGKAIGTDDAGRVYITRNKEIQVYSSDLSSRLLTVTGFSSAEGVHVARKDSGSVYLYNSERNVTSGQVMRMVLDESTMFLGGTAAWAGDASFGVGGKANVGAGFDDVRGLATDALGNIWAAENDNYLLKISSDGLTTTSIGLSDAFDVAVDGSIIFVSQDDDKTVSVIDAGTMAIVDTLSVPFAALGLDPTGQSGVGTLGGIDLVAGTGLYVSNEAGQSVTPSPFSGYAGDDNEPVLRLVPEPTLLSLLAAGMGLAARRRKRRA